MYTLFAPISGILIITALLAGCAVNPVDRGAFDLETNSLGKVDNKGFPVVSGAQYQRDVPLKRTIERAALEAELQALAESRASSAVKVDQRRSQLLQQRLKQIARTHGPKARAEIASACKTDADGVVSCNTD